MNRSVDTKAKKHRPSEEQEQSKKVWLAPLAAVALVAVLYFMWPAFHTFVNEAYEVLSSGDQKRIESWVDGFGGWAFAVVLALMLLQTRLLKQMLVANGRPPERISW